MDDRQLREIESAAVEFAQGAGRILLDHFRRPLRVEFKGRDNRNPVTDADYAADAYLREAIAQRFPDHAVISEETGSTEAASEFTWITAPLDGTTNYLHGLPVFGVIITVVAGGTPAAAAIFTPSIREPEGVVTHARAGGGAFVGEERLDLRSDRTPEAVVRELWEEVLAAERPSQDPPAESVVPTAGKAPAPGGATNPGA